MTVFGVPLEDRRVLIMNEMLICGNLFANNISIIGGGDFRCVEEPESFNGSIVKGDLTIDGTFLVNNKVLVTGDVITKEV